MTQPKVDPKKKNYSANNPAEVLKEFSGEVLNVPKGIFEEAQVQFGFKKPLSGEFKLNTAPKPLEQPKAPEGGSRFFQQVKSNELNINKERQKAIEAQVARLMQELQVEVVKLQRQTAELTGDVKKITVESKPAKSGIYHLNFFDMMITMLKELRQKVGESRMWLNKSQQKKKQKGYWAMFKKHGMNFAASDERAVASSNG